MHKWSSLIIKNFFDETSSSKWVKYLWKKFYWFKYHSWNEKYIRGLYIQKWKYIKKSKTISNNGVYELHLKTKAVKREQKPKNDFTQRNRADTLNMNQEERHSNIQLNNSKGELNK